MKHLTDDMKGFHQQWATHMFKGIFWNAKCYYFKIVLFKNTKKLNYITDKIIYNKQSSSFG